MVEKLRLPFPLLSDFDGERTVKPYGVWHEGRDVARPAVIVVAPDGSETFRQVGEDFADRVLDDRLVEELRNLRLEPVEQEPPAPGDARPGENAMPVDYMCPFYRGARFAAAALALRVPEVGQQAERLVAVVERYSAATQELEDELRESGQEG